MDYKDEKIELNIPKVVHVDDFEVGVIIARFQVPELHPVHIELIDTVLEHHKKVIIFLAVPVIEQTKRNPLDFSTRKMMIQTAYPNITILPIRDQRDNKTWSFKLDEKISEPFGNRKPLLYGSRDSFIPYYHGRHQTVELIGNNMDISGTAIREDVSKQIIDSADFRRGIIYANYGRYPNKIACVDIVVYDREKHMILLGRKPNENSFRFIGGHTEVIHDSYEHTAMQELSEEAPGICLTGGVDSLEYICSARIKDWRHVNEDSEIFSILYLGTRMSGQAKAADDIEEVKWYKMDELMDYEQYSKVIMPEHIDFFGKLVKYFEKQGVNAE